MTTPRSHRARPSAFTIIELLVIVSIIVLLLAILLPALAGARKSAKKNVCMSNLKSAADAARLFQENNRGDFPTTTFTGDAAMEYKLFGAGTTDAETKARPLNLYLKNAVEVAQCPLDKGSDVTGSAEHAYDAASGVGTSYWYPPIASSMGISAIQPVQGLNIREIRYPAKKLVTADLVINWARKAPDDTSGGDARHGWHNGRDPLQVSVAYADGHSEFAFRKLESEWTSKAAYTTVPEELLDHPANTATTSKKAPYY